MCVKKTSKQHSRTRFDRNNQCMLKETFPHNWKFLRHFSKQQRPWNFEGEPKVFILKFKISQKSLLTILYNKQFC